MACSRAYVYPAAMRATRDLLRRRLHFVRKRGQLLARIQNTIHPYNLDPFGKRIAYPANREGLLEHFPDPAVLYLRHSIDGRKLLARLERKHGKGKALSILAHKVGRAVYYILARGTVFSQEKFAWQRSRAPWSRTPALPPKSRS